MATRASSRIPKDGILIADKAMKRAQERDELPGNPFTILNNTPNDVLQSVALDLDIANDFVDDNLVAIKAEDRVRANLAQANYRTYLENLKSKEIPQGEEDLHYLHLKAIDNSSRDGMGCNSESASLEANIIFST